MKQGKRLKVIHLKSELQDLSNFHRLWKNRDGKFHYRIGDGFPYGTVRGMLLSSNVPYHLYFVEPEPKFGIDIKKNVKPNDWFITFCVNKDLNAKPFKFIRFEEIDIVVIQDEFLKEIKTTINFFTEKCFLIKAATNKRVSENKIQDGFVEAYCEEQPEFVKVNAIFSYELVKSESSFVEVLEDVS